MVGSLQAAPLGVASIALLWTIAGLAWLQVRESLPVSLSEGAYLAVTSGAIVGVANFGPGGPVWALALGFGGVLVGLQVERL